MLSVIGLGFVGLTMSLCLAEKGFRVIAVDRDKGKLRALSRGVLPFYEPGLANLLRQHMGQRLKLSSNLGEAVNSSDTTFIAVATPSRPDGSIDLTSVKQVLRALGVALRRKKGRSIVTLRSTVIPGTTANMARPVLERASGLRCGEKFDLCYCPEFLSEGTAIKDTFHPSRLIIGEFSAEAGKSVEDVFRQLHENPHPPTLHTNPTTAEMIKYASNAYLATKISFINEIAKLCEPLPNVDVNMVAKGIGLDPRIGGAFLKAGLGFGGSCLPKDLKALTRFADKVGRPSVLLKAVLAVNEAQARWAVERAESELGGLQGKRVAILGLAFKPDTSDVREAVSIKIIRELLRRGAHVSVFDPQAMGEVKKIFGKRLTYASTPLDCIRGSHCAIIATEWREFLSLNPLDFESSMRFPLVLDGRKLYEPDKFRGTNVIYRAVGLGQTYHL